MKPGQRLTLWWQEYVMGRLRSPQALYAASRAESPDRTEDRFTQTPVDNPEWDTPSRLMFPQFLTSEAYARQGVRADWQQCNPQMRLLFAKVVLRAKGIGIPLYVHCAFRTRTEQNALRKKGVSKVSYPNSAHNIGEAVDLVHGIYHWELTEREWSYIHWLVMDELRKLNAKTPKALQLQLNWGGNDGTPADKFRWDPAHWEVLDYRNRTRALPEAVPVHMSPAVTVARFR